MPSSALYQVMVLILDTCLHFLNREQVSSNIYKAHHSTLNAHGSKSPPNGSSLRPPPYPEWSLGSAPLPLSHPGSAAGRGGCGRERCGEAGSAPIWRTAVAGKQGAEGTETCVTSFGLLSLLPRPTGPCPLLGEGPMLQIGGGSKRKGVEYGGKLLVGKIFFL